MSPSRFALCVALLVVVEYATGNLIRGKSDGAEFASKDVPIPKDDVERNELSIPIDAPSDLSVGTPKKCGEIGDHCVNHSDCCSFACLGYLKRCVSGSG